MHNKSQSLNSPERVWEDKMDKDIIDTETHHKNRHELQFSILPVAYHYFFSLLYFFLYLMAFLYPNSLSEYLE